LLFCAALRVSEGKEMVRNSSARCKACFMHRSKRLLRRCTLLVFVASPLVTAGSQRALQRDADKRIVVDLGHNLGGAASLRILKHLEPWTYQPLAGETHEQLVQQLLAAVAANDTAALPHVDGKPLFLVTLGDTTAAAIFIEAELAGVGNEGFVVHSQHRNGVTVLAANGNAMSEATARSTLSQQPVAGKHTASVRGDNSPHRHLVNTGAVTAAYAALEELGFAFFHPLQPISPVLLRQPEELHREEAPRWHYRGFHIHTQHPLELTDVLQGFDVIGSASSSTAKQQSDSAAAVAAAGNSSGGRFRYLRSLWSGSSSSSSSNSAVVTEAVDADVPLSEQLTEPYAGMHSDHHQQHRSAATEGDGSTTAADAAAAANSASTTANTTTATAGNDSGSESWDSMLSDVEAFFEWCAANRVNRVEWMLLGDDKWDSVAHSPLRQSRLARLVSIAHSYGVLAGADVPIGLQQQHAWYMVKPKQSRQEQTRAIQERCDWVAAAGFDFISTESGLSEFTHPGDELMLSLMDTFANHVVSVLSPVCVVYH
jgi:hypothetical protein